MGSRRCSWPVRVLAQVCGVTEESGDTTVQTVKGVKKDFKLNSEMDGKPVQGMKNGVDLFLKFEFLKALARDPHE